MFQLPKDIIAKIWQFDNTYKEIMNTCLLELQSATPYWGLRVMFEKKYHIKTMERNKYDKYFNVNKKLANYWNRDYRKIFIESNRRLDPKQSRYWTYNEFICDAYPKMYNRIFQNIKNYKHKMYRVDQMTIDERRNFYQSLMMVQLLD